MFGFLKRRKKKLRKRGYAGAESSRLLADFISSSMSADAEIKGSLKELRNRSRDRCRNDPYARRYMQVLGTNIIGENGLNLQVRARDTRRSGQSEGALDIVGNRMIEDAWKRWGRRGTVDVTGRLSWIDAQRLFIESLARDGEVLVRHVRNADNQFGYSLEFIESDYLDETLEKTLPNGNSITMGVEQNSYGKPVAYWLLRDHPGIGWGAVRRDHFRVDAADVMHEYMPERSHQSRGVPWLATSLKRMKILDGYEEAELVAARVAAAKMGFFTSPDGDGFVGDSTEETHTPVMEADPGSFQQLAAGQTFEAWDPTHPTTAYQDFHKTILRGIASGLGVSYVSLSNNLEGVSYSSIRQGTLEDRDHHRMIQTFMVNHFAEPIFREWLKMSMTKGAINLPPGRFDKFSDASVFRGRGYHWVDPLKEINAAIAAVQNGFMSLQDVAANYGRDVEDVMEQIQRDKTMAERYGISLAFEPLGSKHAPVQAQTETGADDE